MREIPQYKIQFAISKIDYESEAPFKDWSRET